MDLRGRNKHIDIGNRNWLEIEDIVTNILSRLSVKAITNCKFVCKDWYRLLNSPLFIKAQLNRAKEKPVYIVYPHMYFLPNVYFMESNGKVIDLIPLPACRDFSSLSMICTFNGLIFCINYVGPSDMTEVSDLDIVICNPATQDVLLLPNGSPSFEDPAVGVAFGPGVNEYKVYRFFCTESETELKLVQYEVYSSITGSWRAMGNVEYFPMDSSHVFVNGRVYWFLSSDEHPVPGSILSVGMDENFQEIKLPDDFVENAFLIDLDGSLSLVTAFGDNDVKMSIWVLKDDNESIWEKKCSDCIPVDPIECVDSVAAQKNELFLITSTHYLIFNIENKTWTEIDIDDIFEENFPIAFAFTESLLPCKFSKLFHKYVFLLNLVWTRLVTTLDK